MDKKLVSRGRSDEDGDTQSLETLLARSIAAASPHTKGIFGNDTMTAKEIEAFVSKRTAVAVATTDREGHPHIAATDLIVVQGRFFIGQSQGSASLKHIRRDERVALLLMQGWRRHLLLEGQTSCLADNDPMTGQVKAAEKERLGFTSQIIVEVSPSRMFGWKSGGPRAKTRADQDNY